MTDTAPDFGGAEDVEAFTDAEAAAERIEEIYEEGARIVRKAFEALPAGGLDGLVDARYPFLGVEIGQSNLNLDARHAFGVALDAGIYGTTLTRPTLYRSYLREQIAIILRRHRVPVWVGIGQHPIPLAFVIEASMAALDAEAASALQHHFVFPDLKRVDDTIANGTHVPPPGAPKPLALFNAERTDYSLARLRHYTGTSPEQFQSFVLLTNYQRYVDSFLDWGRSRLGQDGYETLVEPGDLLTTPDSAPPDDVPRPQPQMPAYHLTRPDGDGITMVNIGVGPSNAKTITDHLAVLRPHCWLMVGHCAGLRRSQQLGDYVLAHGYVRDDQVLDHDLPQWVPVPPIAEVQVALMEATAKITGLQGPEMKTRVRTGSVLSTSDRNWELRFRDLQVSLNQSRAIAVDMESATIAANGFRFRVPYGALLCVSDKPVHGEIKLGGVANQFYRERVSQHLMVGIETMEALRRDGVDRLHSRKLRGFDEPLFR